MKMRPFVPLKDKTWFRTGGPARWFCEPTTDAEFSRAAAFAHDKGIPLVALGEGANVLVSDDGIAALVVRPRNTGIRIVPGGGRGRALVCAGAGASVADLIEFCLDRRLIGLEEFSGIPGSVGGAVFINIHYFDHLLAECVAHGRVMDVRTGSIACVAPSWFRFGYDQSRLREGTHLLVDATFSLRRGTAIEAAYAKGRRDEMIRQRHRRYPTERTCGSFFRNFLTSELRRARKPTTIASVAFYLDLLGIKGVLRVGGARVSPKHANMIENCGTATARDIARLARTMQTLVRRRFGLVPQPECQLLGFAGRQTLN